MPGHLDRLLSERIGNRALVEAGLAEDDGYRVPQSVKREPGSDLALLLQSRAQVPP
jgi:hypothetical protein